MFKTGNPEKKLSNLEKIISSVVGGTLACWNQPIEVIRVEMQSIARNQHREEMRSTRSMLDASNYIYKTAGIRGFFRGVIPRVGLGVWATVCMVFGGEKVKEWMAGEHK